MKFRIILICAAMMMAACCGNSGNKSCKSNEKAGCKESTEKSCAATCGKSSSEKGCKHADLIKIISAQVFIKSEKVNDFLSFTKELIEKSRAEEGCISYTLYQDPNDKSTFLFFEEWKSQAAIDFHFATEHFKKFDEKMGEFASKPPVITIYDAKINKE